jgi:serine/threonine protein kinase/tetratricopeptide (TPR) repeat protein
MTPQQYERLTELFHAAVEIAPDERAVFLDRVSNGDAELRRELESLLHAHEQRAGYTEKPPDDIAAGMYMAEQNHDAANRDSLPPKTRIDRYEIRSLLGKGGMGEVYLAEDTILRRLVALKVLPVVATANEDRMRRFVQEATTAAGLSHPHIAQIFEVGEYQGTHFIAMELVDGMTLREKIHSERTDLRKLLKYLQQVAEGLAKAHAAGIVHRDLKPDNIMITRDDYAKILDFGLAKLVETERALGLGGQSSSEVGTRIMAQQSMAGMVLGTAGYMSPEQAQGKVKEIDQRSDIFSFGCILFEAATGHKPFEGQDLLDSLHKIVHAPTPQIRDINANAPNELQRIVRRCLAKDPEERYQTIKDVALELKEVRQGTGVPAESHTTVTSAGSTETLGRQTNELSAMSTSSAEYVVNQIKSHKRSVAITLAVLVIAVAALAYFFYFKRNRARPVTDTILIADFDNKTGDAAFDGTLKQALAYQLEQSPFLNIFPDDRIEQVLRFMKRAPDERVTRDVAREICQRRGLKAMLVGSITSLGAHYSLALEVVNAQTGDVLARAQKEAASKEGVLEALGMAATDLRQKLGESLRSIQEFDAPIREATTSSLEALKVFAQADTRLEPDRLKEISLLKRAIEIDPNFALAYAKLAVLYQNNRQPEAATEAAQKAFDLKDRVSEPERLEISIRYYSEVTGEWDKVIETAEVWKSTYPDKSVAPYNMLAVGYHQLGQFDKAAEAAKQAIRLVPKWSTPYTLRGAAFLQLNRFADAKEVFEQDIAQSPDATYSRQGLYFLAFISGDAAEMQKQLDWAGRQPDEFARLAFHWQAQTAAFGGQWQKAHELSRRVVDLAAGRGDNRDAAHYAAGDALRDAVFGRCEQSKTAVMQALALERDRASLVRSGLGLALCGEAGQLQKLFAEMKERYPKDILINRIWLPVIQAAKEIKGSNPAAAIQTLQPASRYEAAAQFWPQYLRGQAYLKLGRGAEAAVEFQKILDHRGQGNFSMRFGATCPVLYPLAHLGLARAVAMGADTAKARLAYQDFFALWKDADPDLPMLIEARKEYEKLK